MVVTVLEARVASENIPLLESAFTSAVRQLDPGIMETFLLSDTKDPALWQIVTLWRDRQALDAMRSSGQTPRGMLIFREAKAEPSLSIRLVAAHARA